MGIAGGLRLVKPEPFCLFLAAAPAAWGNDGNAFVRANAHRNSHCALHVATTIHRAERRAVSARDSAALNSSDEQACRYLQPTVLMESDP